MAATIVGNRAVRRVADAECWPRGRDRASLRSNMARAETTVRKRSIGSALLGNARAHMPLISSMISCWQFIRRSQVLFQIHPALPFGQAPVPQQKDNFFEC